MMTQIDSFDNMCMVDKPAVCTSTVRLLVESRCKGTPPILTSSCDEVQRCIRYSLLL